MNPTSALDAARLRWSEAEERLYPTLIADPAAAARAVDAIRALLAVLRRHGEDPFALAAAAVDPDALVAASFPSCTEFPAELLVGVACAARLRELRAILADQDHRRIERLLARGRTEGRAWVVLDGPEDPDALSEGRTVAVHVASRTVLTATVEPWTDGQSYALLVHPHGGSPLSRRFPDRAEWLDEHRMCRRDVEALHEASTAPAATRTGAR